VREMKDKLTKAMLIVLGVSLVLIVSGFILWSNDGESASTIGKTLQDAGFWLFTGSLIFLMVMQLVNRFKK